MSHCLLRVITSIFTLISFDPDFQTFQFDSDQNYRCETSSRPKRGGLGPDQTEPWFGLLHQNKMSRRSTWGQEETRCLIDIWSDDFGKSQLEKNKNTDSFQLFQFGTAGSSAIIIIF